MKIGIILNSSEPETVWNAFRFGVEALNKGHTVKLFLLGNGVEAENAKDDRFQFMEGAIGKFMKNNGVLLACGTCLKIREKEGSKICPVSTMEEMLRLVEESDKILTFG
ncbi:MAG: DsrE family protein [archaeon]